MASTYRTLGMTALIFAATSVFAGDGKLRLAGMFSDHMVLQRDQVVKVWGKATPYDNVVVKLSDETSNAVADDSGEWVVKLPAQKAGGPYTLTVSDADDTTTVQDVLIGEVWVCSGQSNMAFNLRSSKHGHTAISESSNPNIRLFQVARDKALMPLDEFTTSPQWEVCSPETTPDFSAVAYYFGSSIQKELGVPIGLIESAWGGTKVEWWTPLDGLRKVPFYADAAREMDNAVSDDELIRNFRKANAAWEDNLMAEDPGNLNMEAAWAKPDFNDADWKLVALPGMLEDIDLGNYDGSVWYRRNFTLTAEQAAKPATLLLRVDDADVSFINGMHVGTLNSPNKQRTYQIDSGILKEGTNTIALQVWDWGKPGGISANANQFGLEFSEGESTDVMSLAGDWKFSKGIPLPTEGRPKAPQAIRPTVLYNAMIAPMLNYAIRGAIWYQGEGNANADAAPVYDEIFSTMISEWRRAWDIGEFPFLFVQLASFKKISSEPAESDWAVLRESQTNTLELVKNTAMASAIDIGEQDDIHPTNKHDVGKRLALAALATTYGKRVEYQGPTYKSHSVTDNTITVVFDHADGLNTRSEVPVQGFAIAGNDGKFVWATAEIKDNTVRLSADGVTEPAKVRYGWADYSTGNLYNEAGLPTNPFRTDNPND